MFFNLNSEATEPKILAVRNCKFRTARKIGVLQDSHGLNRGYELFAKGIVGRNCKFRTARVLLGRNCKFRHAENHYTR